MIERSGIRIEIGKDKIRDNHPGDEIRKEQGGLIDLDENTTMVAQLIQQECDEDRADQAAHDKQHIHIDSIIGNAPDLAGPEEKRKVLEADPGAIEDAQC